MRGADGLATAEADLGRPALVCMVSSLGGALGSIRGPAVLQIGGRGLPKSAVGRQPLFQWRGNSRHRRVARARRARRLNWATRNRTLATVRNGFISSSHRR